MKHRVVAPLSAILSVLCTRPADRLVAFFDQTSIRLNEEAEPALRTALAATRLLIVVVSKHFFESRWCRAEVEAFRQRGDPVLPLFWDVQPKEARARANAIGVECAELATWLCAKKGLPPSLQGVCADYSDEGLVRAFVVDAALYAATEAGAALGVQLMKPGLRDLARGELVAVATRAYERLLAVHDPRLALTANNLLSVVRQAEDGLSLGGACVLGQPRAVVADYVSRPAVEQALISALRARRERQGGVRAVLCGAGGMGKSQLAAEYVRMFRANYRRVLWLPAADATQLQDAYVTVASAVDLAFDPKDPTTAERAVLQWLRRPTERGWLLVLDNVDGAAYENIKDHIPRRDDVGDVLVTSRDTRWAARGYAPVKVRSCL